MERGSLKGFDVMNELKRSFFKASKLQLLFRLSHALFRQFARTDPLIRRQLKYYRLHHEIDFK